MTAKTGNVYISGTMTNSVEKSNGKSGFSTTASSTEVSLSHCDNVKQRQDWRPKRLYCHFWWSVIVAVAKGYFHRARRRRKLDLPLEFQCCLS